MLSKITKCRECGSTALTWQTHNKNISQAQHGRLRAGDICCQLILGCDQCSETLAIYSADHVAVWLTDMQGKTEARAPECSYCGDTGQIMVGRSGDAEDGNAPIMQPCEDCDLGSSAPKGAALIPEISNQRGGHFYNGWNACREWIAEQLGVEVEKRARAKHKSRQKGAE